MEKPKPLKTPFILPADMASLISGTSKHSDSKSLSPAAAAVLTGAQTEAERDMLLGLETEFPIALAGETTSTFDLVWQLERLYDLPPWSAVMAHSQSMGRGQMRRPWQSPPGNLYVSFKLPDDPLLSGDCASVLLGYILLKAFGEEGYALLLKWPNDMLLQSGAKVAGFLLEEKDGVLMAGLGVNIVSAPQPDEMRKDFSAPAGCLYPLDGLSAPPPFLLWQKLVKRLNLGYTTFLKGKKLRDVLREIEQHLAWRGKRVLLKENATIIASGLLQGLSPGGGILLHDGVSLKEYLSGSLSPA